MFHHCTDSNILQTVFVLVEMLKRLISYGRSSSSGGLDDDGSEPKSKAPPKDKPRNLNTPVMRLAMSKIAKGHSATLMTELARASVEEAGKDHVSEGV